MRTTLYGLGFMLSLFIAFIYWMSPMGLGFNASAVDKLQNPILGIVYVSLFFALPIFSIGGSISWLLLKRDRVHWADRIAVFSWAVLPIAGSTMLLILMS